MSNGLIVFCDFVILGNLFAFALILLSDFQKKWFALVGFALFVTACVFLVLTIGDIAIWLEKIDRPLWFMNRSLRAAWRAPLGLTLTAINLTFIGLRRNSG